MEDIEPSVPPIVPNIMTLTCPSTEPEYYLLDCECITCVSPSLRTHFYHKPPIEPSSTSPKMFVGGRIETTWENHKRLKKWSKPTDYPLQLLAIEVKSSVRAETSASIFRNALKGRGNWECSLLQGVRRPSLLGNDPGSLRRSPQSCHLYLD